MRRSLSSRRNKVPSVALPHLRHSLHGLVRPIEIIARQPIAIIWERDLPWVRTSGALTPVNQIRPLRIAAGQRVDSEPRAIEETSTSCCSRHGHRPAPSPTQSIQCTPYPAQGIGSKLRIVEMTNISRSSRHRPRLAPSQNSQAPTHNSGTMGLYRISSARRREVSTNTNQLRGPHGF